MHDQYNEDLEEVIERAQDEGVIKYGCGRF